MTEERTDEQGDSRSRITLILRIVWRGILAMKFQVYQKKHGESFSVCINYLHRKHANWEDYGWLGEDKLI